MGASFGTLIGLHPAAEMTAIVRSASHAAASVLFRVRNTLPEPAVRFRLVHLPSAIACAVAVLSASFDVRPAPPPDTTRPGGSPVDTSRALQQAVEAAVADPSLSSAAVGVAVVDVESGRILASLNEHLALNPASNAKLYTAGAALATLRGEHRYETTLSGNLSGDAVMGPLVLRGFGDPSLKTADLWQMVQDLKQFGVRRVEGDIEVDQAFYDAQTTPPGFDQQPNEWAAFRAPVSAVALDENCVDIIVHPTAVGAPALIDIDPPGFVDVEGTVRTGRPGTADDVRVELAAAPNQRMTAVVSGSVSADSRVVRYTRRAEDPRLLAGYAFKALLDASGIRVSGGVKTGSGGAHLLAKHVSGPLSSLLYELGKQSDNFYAEMIFKSLAGETKRAPARHADASEIVAQWLDRIGANDAGVVLHNGSGLFDTDRVTAYSTVELLRWAWRDPAVQSEYVAQLAVAGADGTLRKRFRNDPSRRIRAKTGTLDDAIALSGYVGASDGRAPIAFSVIFNHVSGRQDNARRAADRIAEAVMRLYP
jgi:serine-type D-Ala-D-Ala carboxypeptidase/endopeptidase (penicillin-binding protein 4)